MPPKAAAESAVDPLPSFLLHVMATTETEVKGSECYHLFGLTGPKNLARKVDGLVKPYGYKLDHGKIVRLDDASTTIGTTAPKTSSKRAATPANTNDTASDDANESPPKKAKTNSATKPAPKSKGKGKIQVKEEAEVKDEADTTDAEE